MIMHEVHSGFSHKDIEGCPEALDDVCRRCNLQISVHIGCRLRKRGSQAVAELIIFH